MLSLPTADCHGLIRGDVITAFVSRGTVTEGDEDPLLPSGPRAPGELKEIYRRFNDVALPDGPWLGVVVAVHPSSLLDPEAGSADHLLVAAPDADDLILVRVYGPGGPVLSDAAFEARVASVAGALTG